MTTEFVKSHGAGNDFVLIEDLADRLRPQREFVAALCDRHTGVGADGLIRIAPAADADFFMDYYNADGAVAEMCGNGIRCLVKYVADRDLVATTGFRVGTRAGSKDVTFERDADGLVTRVRVDMGPPILERSRIPVTGEGDPVHVAVEAGGERFDAACVSMGNPHCVIFVPTLEGVAVERLGPAIETLPAFPARTNVEFVERIGPADVRVRVWERGVGETMACGSGACAVAVAGHLRGLTDRSVGVHLPGGTLDIEWTDRTVFLSGPVAEVFRGTLDERLERALLAGAPA